MKKLFLATALLFFATNMNAQFHFGIKGGYNSSLCLENMSSIKSGEYDLNSVKAELSNEFRFGAFARMGTKVYFQPEFLYAVGNNKYTITLQDAVNNELTYDKIVTISTLDIPLMVGYTIFDKNTFNFRAFAGPKIRLDAGSKLSFQNLVNGGSLTIDDIKPEIQKSQIGFEAGVGIDVLMFTLDARMNLIGDMYKTNINDLHEVKMPNNTFVISLGWKIF